MDLQPIQDFLSRTIGLDVNSIGVMALRRAVDARMSARGSASVRLYGEQLQASGAEQQALIDSIVVPETWFFRDRDAFAALASWAVAELRARPGEPLRLLSMPCSTGEEPYSMAMALLDSGIPPGLFRIDAVDISPPAISSALKAEYGRNSFRGEKLAFRERYFEEHGPKHRLRDEVRSLVEFGVGNLFAGAGGRPLAAYHAVFCRNVLIYFDRAAQARAIEILHQLLRPGGLLFVAPAETALPRSQAFSAQPWPGAFAFRKAAMPVSEAVPVTPPAVPRRRRAAVMPAPAPQRSSPAAPPAAPVAVRQADAASLQQIALLADQGRLEEAEACALQCLRSDASSAQAYYWLGIIDDARGRAAAAATHYRRALYLDPGHQEALTHLALLLDKQGQTAAAATLRGRIRRLEVRRAG
jgi:chemotaxis protein methyltransferase WspC